MSESHPHYSGTPDIEPSGEWDAPWIVRTMTEADLDAVVRLDMRQTGSHRTEYYAEKLARCIGEPRLNTSLLAEQDGAPVGFLIGRLFFGEFGIPATRAVLDTLGVHPAFRQQGVAHTLVDQYRKNLTALRVEAIDTLVDWDRFDLLAFFKAQGFRPSRDMDLVWNVARFPFLAREPSNGALPAVRQAGPDDLAAIAAMDREVLGEGRGTYFDVKWDAAQARPEQNRFLIAELQGEPAGYLIAGLYRGEFGIEVARGVIDTLGVRERFQHRGVASALVQHLRDWLEGHGVRQMETLCRWNDWELLPFFEYVGFRPSARINLEWRIG